MSGEYLLPLETPLPGHNIHHWKVTKMTNQIIFESKQPEFAKCM